MEVITNAGVDVQLTLAQKVELEAVKIAAASNDVKSFSKLWSRNKYNENLPSDDIKERNG